MFRMPKPPTLNTRSEAGAVALVLLLSTWLAAPRAHAQAQLVEALVCVVGADTPGEGADVVMLSDVTLIASLAMARRREAVVMTPALLEAARDELVGEILIERESRRLHTGEPTTDEVTHQRERIARSVGGADVLQAQLAAWDVSDMELNRVAARRATVERFLTANLEGGTSATDAEVEDAFRTESHPFVGRTFEEVREALRGWLEVTRLEQSVARWLTVLRQRSVVHIVRELNPSR